MRGPHSADRLWGNYPRLFSKPRQVTTPLTGFAAGSFTDPPTGPDSSMAGLAWHNCPLLQESRVSLAKAMESAHLGFSSGPPSLRPFMGLLSAASR